MTIHHETIQPTEFTRNGTIGSLGRISRPIFRSSFNLYVLNKPAANLMAPSTCPALCEPRTIVDFARLSLTACAMDIVAGSWSVWRMTVVWPQWSSIATMQFTFVFIQLLVCDECALCMCFAIDQVQNCNRLIQLLA